MGREGAIFLINGANRLIRSKWLCVPRLDLKNIPVLDAAQYSSTICQAELMAVLFARGLS